VRIITSKASFVRIWKSDPRRIPLSSDLPQLSG
jgi:hypothetical protein